MQGPRSRRGAVIRAPRPDCVTATLPPPEVEGRLASVDFSSPDVKGLLGLQAGGVRLLTIDWNAHDLSANRSGTYQILVTDAASMTTGSLTKVADYSERMPNGEGCGVQWWADISD